MAYAGRSATTPEAHYDAQREREFYRYYDPIRALSASGPRWTDLYDEEATRAHQPSSCPDLSLTAFCQLGALRLNVRRCMLFFFDTSSAYVLAEATRTLSLHDHAVHDTGDELWLGFTIIPRGLSVCEHTVNMPTTLEVPERDEGTGLLHIIDDLTASTTFCDRPFVKDGPRARFYAGVPLITPEGVAIGAYCALDDTPRDGLNESEVKFMKDMGKTVMAHLQTVRERAEYNRGGRMLQGLGSFVHEASTRGERGSKAITGRARVSAPEEISVTVGDDDLANTVLTDGTADSNKHDSQVPVAVPLAPNSTISRPAAEKPRFQANGGDGGTSSLDPDEGKTVREVLNHAAVLVREAVDADGCVVLDPTSAALRLGRVANSSNFDSFSDQSAATIDTGSDSSDAPVVPPSITGNCAVLGQSLRPTLNGSVRSSGTVQSSFLHRLLRKYPRGKIWNFNDEGDNLSSDLSSSTTPATALDHGGRNSGSVRSKKRRPRQNAATDAAELRRIFPTARSLLMIGMWDVKYERWRAGVLVWSISPVRVFAAKTELNYIIAFGEVIMAEVANVEAKREEKKRSDFVSSISHELRSPLHGILGSLDMMKQDDASLGDSADVKQIESCSLAMLDLVEHLLNYAEDRHQAVQRHHRSDPSSSPSTSGGASDLRQTKDMSPLISLATATEEIADALLQSYQSDPSRTSADAIDMSLDLALGPEYKSRVGGGEWERICTNLIDNALKFTAKGHIAISLRLRRNKARETAILEVSDTGCGMSEDFLATGLFRAFQQEDNLVSGMGLGMKLTSKIVKRLGGRMEVESKPQRGTTVKVLLPVEVDHDTNSTVDNASLSSICAYMGDNSRSSSGDYASSTGQRPVLEAVRQTLHRIGVELVKADSAMITILTAEELVRTEYEASKPTLVLCRDAKSMEKLRDAMRASSKTRGFAKLISQPYGPMRLAKAIRACVNDRGSDHPVKADIITSVSRRSSRIHPEILFGSLRRSSDAPPSRRQSCRDTSTTEPIAQSETGTGLATAHRDARPRSGRSTPDASSPRLVGLGSPRPPSAPFHEHTPQPVIHAKVDTSKPPLLLVDDNPVNLRLLTTWAKKTSHPYLTATNGQEAVNAFVSSIANPTLASLKPDVILLDINMPIMDGFEAAQHIRRYEKTHSISPTKVVALTGLGTEEARLDAKAAGIDMFLTKPVRLKELAGLLDELTRPR